MNKEYKEQKAGQEEAAIKGEAHMKKAVKSDAEIKGEKNAAENKATKQVDKATAK